MMNIRPFFFFLKKYSALICTCVLAFMEHYIITVIQDLYILFINNLYVYRDRSIVKNRYYLYVITSLEPTLTRKKSNNIICYQFYYFSIVTIAN